MCLKATYLFPWLIPIILTLVFDPCFFDSTSMFFPFHYLLHAKYLKQSIFEKLVLPCSDCIFCFDLFPRACHLDDIIFLPNPEICLCFNHIFSHKAYISKWLILPSYHFVKFWPLLKLTYSSSLNFNTIYFHTVCLKIWVWTMPIFMIIISFSPLFEYTNTSDLIRKWP